MPLLLGLQDTFGDEIPCNQSSSSTTYSGWQNILKAITVMTVWLEGGNTQGGVKPGHSRPVGSISKRRGVPARWWSTRRSNYCRSGRRTVDHEVWWFFYSKLKRRGSGPLLQWWRDHGTLIQVGISVFKQYSRIQGLPDRVDNGPWNGDQTLKGGRRLQFGSLPG